MTAGAAGRGADRSPEGIRLEPLERRILLSVVIIIDDDPVTYPPVITGTEGDDVIRVGGTHHHLIADVNGKIETFDGDFWNVGLSIRGGAGNDRIALEVEVPSTIDGGLGDDTLTGGPGSDELFGSEGNDLLCGGDMWDSLVGGAGNDTLNGGASTDTIKGGTGNDVLRGNRHEDILFGGRGRDSLYGGGGNDTLNGADGGDSISGAAGDDALNGGRGNDAISGGADNDTLDGGRGDDSVWGGLGEDVAYDIGPDGVVTSDPAQIFALCDGVEQFQQLLQHLPEQIVSFAAPASAVQMVYSSSYHLLFIRDAAGAIHVIDTQSQAQADLHSAVQQFTDMDLSPSGRYLYAADFGGEVDGDGAAIPPSLVHRYDLATRQWQTARQVEYAAYSIAAVDDDAFLTLNSAEYAVLALNRWESATPSITFLDAADRDVGVGDIEYDPASQRVLHGVATPTHTPLTMWRVVNGQFVAGETGLSNGGTIVVSPDGRSFYNGGVKVETVGAIRTAAVFPEVIYAASPLLAFGQDAYYYAGVGERVGTLGFTTTVYAMNAEGTELFAYNPSDGTLHQYLI